MEHDSKKIRLDAKLVQADRWQIGRIATIRLLSGVAAECMISNISLNGFRMHCPAPVVPGQTLWLEMGNGDPLRSKVIWSDDEIAGCEFINPVGRAMYSEIILRAIGPDRLGEEVYI